MAMTRFADHIAEVIRLNPIPWLFAPGIALAGYLLDGPSGAVTALGAWTSIVSVGTIWVVARRRWWRQRKQDTTPPRSP